MRVAGIDASTNKTGVAIMCDGVLEEYKLIDMHSETDTSIRIQKMMYEICSFLEWVDDLDAVIMEKSVLKTNIDTVQKLSNLSGGVMLYCYSRKLKWTNPTPSQWRAKIGMAQSNKIKRPALKRMAIDAVSKEYGIDVCDDVAEAILLARSAFDLPHIDVSVEK